MIYLNIGVQRLIYIGESFHLELYFFEGLFSSGLIIHVYALNIIYQFALKPLLASQFSANDALPRKVC